MYEEVSINGFMIGDEVEVPDRRIGKIVQLTFDNKSAVAQVFFEQEYCSRFYNVTELKHYRPRTRKPPAGK